MSEIPWSSRAPQRYVLAVIAVIIAIAVIITGVGYIANGVGGIVPYLMIIVAPVLAVTYVYVFAFKKWETQ
jgi:hypothetical protein